MCLGDRSVRSIFLSLCLFLASTQLGLAMPPEVDNSGAVFQCSLKDGGGVTNQGRLGRNAGVDWFQSHYNNFIFDVSGGSLSVQGDATYWKVLRMGDFENDLVAQLVDDELGANILRIAAWDTPIRVSMTDGMELYAGLCDRLR